MLIMLVEILVGCSRDESSDSSALQIPTEQYSWSSTVTEQTVALKTQSSWTAKTNVGWCQPWKSSGTKDDKLVLWISPNITSKARSGVLTVSSGGVKKTITIEQPAYTGRIENFEYKLPVVFHVLYKDKSDNHQYVKEGRLAEIIEKVNSLYRENGVKVQFEMAKYDENGNELEEPGVIRHEVEFDEYDCHKFLSDDKSVSEYATYGQDYKKFINLYTFRFEQSDTESEMMGLSVMPLMPSKYPLEGLVTYDGLENYNHVDMPWGCCINSNYVYEESGQNYNPQDVVVTVAHELGHYLGLLHTFSDDGCLKEDGCDDTASSDYENYVAWVEQYIQEKGMGARFTLKELATRQECHTDTAFVADNVMDYSYCLSNKLTKEQIDRMHYVLNYCAIMNGPKLVDYLSATMAQTRNTKDKLRLPVVTSDCPDQPHVPRIDTSSSFPFISQ